MTRLVVVYDASCGGCSAIAAGLSGIFVPEVLARACRDPNLAVEFPMLAGHLGANPCRRPLLVVLHADGSSEVVGGLAMVARGIRLVAPRRWPAAAMLALRLVGTRLRRARRR